MQTQKNNYLSCVFLTLDKTAGGQIVCPGFRESISSGMRENLPPTANGSLVAPDLLVCTTLNGEGVFNLRLAAPLGCCCCLMSGEVWATGVSWRLWDDVLVSGCGDWFLADGRLLEDGWVSACVDRFLADGGTSTVFLVFCISAIIWDNSCFGDLVTGWPCCECCCEDSPTTPPKVVSESNPCLSESEASGDVNGLGTLRLLDFNLSPSEPEAIGGVGGLEILLLLVVDWTSDSLLGDRDRLELEYLGDLVFSVVTEIEPNGKKNTKQLKGTLQNW